MAGAGYKLYATGDVLTAAQVNTYLQEQTVMVFADAAARTTALASVLAEGMISYLKDTDVTQYYSGSASVTIGGSASPLTTKGDLYGYSTTNARVAVGTNGQVLTADSTAATGVAWASGGLTLVKAQTIGSAVSSVTVTSAFSATYDNYLILVSGGVGSVDSNIALTLGSASSGYKYAGIYMLYTGTTVTGENSNGAASFPRAVRGSTNSLDGEIVLKNPYNTKRTAAQWRISSTVDGQLWATGGGVLDDATSYTAFTLTPASGTLTGGTIRVYGYQNS